jgi:hypothetical protein
MATRPVYLPSSSIVAALQVPVTKINREYVTLAESCELAPKTEAQLTIVINEKKSTQMILLNDGVASGQRQVRYAALAPF